MIRAAVFGDTHGHLRLMLQLCRLWQKTHGVHLDLVLQCGDLGYFPDPAAADKATRRFAQRDPEELGFARFFAPPDPERDELVSKILVGPADSLDSLLCPVIWCNGNHEDFQALDRLVGDDDLVPVDAFGALKLLRSGRVQELAGLRLAALGGAPEPEDADPGDHGLSEPWKWVGETAALTLMNERFDILLTHCAPSDIAGWSTVWGSRRTRTVVETCQPAYHFYAHHTQPIEPAVIGETRCHWLNDVNFEHVSGRMEPRGGLNRGCMGLLEWEGQAGHRFTVLDETWMSDVTWASWRHL